MRNRFDVKLKSNIKNETILFVDDIFKKFGKKEVLRGLSFELFSGETLALIGRNGCGKTLTMNIIMNTMEKDSGEVYLNLGEKTWNKNIEKVSMQYQANQLMGTKKVKTIVKYYKNFYKNKLSEEELNEMIEVFELKEIWNNKLNSLSGGQKQRLNLFLSLLNNPKILILDEFITGLDINSSAKIIKWINEMKIKKDFSMIIISHEPNEIQSLADRVILLKDGIIAENLTVSEILKKYPSVERYLEVSI